LPDYPPQVVIEGVQVDGAFVAHGGDDSRYDPAKIMTSHNEYHVSLLPQNNCCALDGPGSCGAGFSLDFTITQSQYDLR
jgi:hypothetical protein